jgi:hypothetical protein
VGSFDGGTAVAVIGDRHLTHAGLALASGGVEHLAELGLGFDGDHHVGLASREPAGIGTRDGDADGHALVGKVPELGGLEVEVASTEAHALVAVEQGRDDVDGLAEHLVAHPDRRPALADDMFA